MIGLTSMFTPETMRTLGWTLVHFVWEGAAAAALLYLVNGVTRNAVVRYWAAVLTLTAMSVAPVLTFAMLRERPAKQAAPLSRVQGMWGMAEALTSSNLVGARALEQSYVERGKAAANKLAQFDLLNALVWAWFAGVMIFGARALGGWMLLRRVERQKTGPISAKLRVRCTELQNRLGITRAVRFVESRLVEAPAVTGWMRPLVLLPATALTGLSAEQLEAVIVHELAHIQRWDCFVNLFQIAAETVLFYHPAVWWASRCARRERENCCDDVAVRVCGNAGEYARALAAMEEWRKMPEFAMAANRGPLKARVARILGLGTMTMSVPRGGLAAVGVLCAAGALLAAGTFDVNLLNQAGVVSPATGGKRPAAAFTRSTLDPMKARENADPKLPVVRIERADASIAHSGWPQAEASEQAERPKRPERPEKAEVPETADQAGSTETAPSAEGGSSYIEGIRAAGLRDFKIDDLIALKIQGVTPEYIRAMRTEGFDTDVHSMIAAKTMGVEPAYVHAIRATGLSVTPHDFIAMKTMDVTPEYVRKIRGEWREASAHDIIAMRTQGVEPQDAAQFRQLGLSDLTLHKLIAMKVQGVTPEYVRTMRAAGYTSTNSDEYLDTKVQGIDPEFIQKVRSHGFNNLTLRQLVQLKIAGIF